MKHSDRTPSSPENRTAEILDRIRAIPRGQVASYGDIEPSAPRLVGRILATTHERVPWHRVVRADGSIPKGERQRDLLVREGVPMRGDRVDVQSAGSGQTAESSNGSRTRVRTRKRP